MPNYDLIPGTTLPIDSAEPGVANVKPHAVSLFERIADRDDIAPHELAVVGAALRAYDRAPKRERTIFQQASGETNASTGNLVLQLYLTPAGSEGHVTMVSFDCPGSATITPSAPFANAGSWAFLAIASPGLSGPGSADALRPAMVAFAPDVAGGPILPGQWTFSDQNAPVAFGGEAVYLVVHGGSIAALLSLAIVASYRINVYTV